MNYLISCLALILVGPLFGQSPKIDRLGYFQEVYFGSMREAMQNDHSEYDHITQGLISTGTNNPYFYYHRARALFLNGKSQEALEITRDFLSFSKSGLKLIREDSVFLANLSEKDWEELNEVGSQISPISHAEKAYEINERGFAPEGLAVNPITQSIFLGSIRMGKIVEINKAGEVSDFFSSQEYGIREVLGLELSHDGQELWACAHYIDPDDSSRRSGVFHFDVSSKKLLERFTPDDTLSHELNDLTIVPDHGVFVTDSRNGGVYQISNNEIELFINSEDISLTNGITHNGTDLYIADIFWGVIHYDLKKKKKRWIRTPKGISLTHIDGLAYYKGGLIAHQFSLEGIFYYSLENGQVIEKKTLTIDHPLLKDHTTGDILGNSYYFIANSDIDAINRYGDEITDAQLTNPVILRQELN